MLDSLREQYVSLENMCRMYERTDLIVGAQNYYNRLVAEHIIDPKDTQIMYECLIKALQRGIDDHRQTFLQNRLHTSSL